MAKYLVTGGAGFIGSNLVRHLLQNDHQVVVLDNYATGKRENLDDVAPQIEIIEGDIRNSDVTGQAMAGCEAVLHQAALGSVPRSVEDPDTSHDVNVNGTLSVLNTARKMGVKRVIFAASSSIYGNRAESPKHEDMVMMPCSPYAANKASCEHYMRAFASAYGMETLCLRYFNVFGPRQDPLGAYAAVIPAFASCILDSRPPVIYGDGEQSRDFCHIDNVCEANYQALNAPSEVCDGRGINIACGQSTSLNEILKILGRLLGKSIEPDYSDPRPGDVKHSLADISLANKTIGYQPCVYFAEGLERTIDWYSKNLR